MGSSLRSAIPTFTWLTTGHTTLKAIRNTIETWVSLVINSGLCKLIMMTVSACWKTSLTTKHLTLTNSFNSHRLGVISFFFACCYHAGGVHRDTVSISSTISMHWCYYTMHARHGVLQMQSLKGAILIAKGKRISLP